ncbi:DUF202 domain-containing protein [Nocardiopsis sp. N85]|uniref:DUF202 domain-containing protein n=1 Tax=Nocardiopsis sp. N85 TaxID=3029400 RepID=UPI00237F2739|nr:DUF202 domain-containing protein [Nocardiopsis sp. N85]MDE3723006.1 DUF202 domain-containing protein [Nocardiopsis sp. N85]
MRSPRDRGDPGLQPERTLLSWQRTVILLVVVALLFLRGELVPGASFVPQAPPALRAAVMFGLLAVAIVLGLHLWLRWRRIGEGVLDPETGRTPTAVGAPWAMVMLCVAVLALSVVQILTIVLG